MLVERLSRCRGKKLGGGTRGETKKTTPLRPLPLHPQYMNMSLLQTGLQSHQKQTREKPKKEFFF